MGQPRDVTVRRPRPFAVFTSVGFLAFILLLLFGPGSWNWAVILLIVVNVWGLVLNGRTALMGVTVTSDSLVVRNLWRTFRVPLENVRILSLRPSRRIGSLSTEPILERTVGESIRLDGLLTFVRPNPEWIERSIRTLNEAISERREAQRKQRN
jgi:hypothetical protein